MANADTPRGAWPIRHQTGGTIRASEHTIASAFGTDIFRGDFVKLVAGGGIEDADAGDRLIGVFQGCDYTNAAGEVIFSKYWPASTVATYIKHTFLMTLVLFSVFKARVLPLLRMSVPWLIMLLVLVAQLRDFLLTKSTARQLQHMLASGSLVKMELRIMIGEPT